MCYNYTIIEILYLYTLKSICFHLGCSCITKSCEPMAITTIQTNELCFVFLSESLPTFESVGLPVLLKETEYQLVEQLVFLSYPVG